jgi:hypothetical protein
MAAMNTTYEARVVREGSWWVADVVGVGATQGRNLDEVRRMVVDLVASMEDVPAESFSVKLDIEVPGVTEKVSLARQLVDQAARVQQEAAANSRLVVGELRQRGLSVGDVAKVLGVSPQRVSQIAAKAAARSKAKAIPAVRSKVKATPTRPVRPNPAPARKAASRGAVGRQKKTG